MQEFFHHKTTLNSLPTEIIPEIASYLDLEDIFSLQQANRKLRSSINIPVVWLTVAKAYSAQHFHIYQPQSGRFDDLTEDELHKWIRKRLHFDRIWESQTFQPRWRSLLQPSIRVPKLVPGGRWLLAGCQEGSVRYCDLDSKSLEWKVLIEPIEGYASQTIYRLETYGDRKNASGIEFTLAMCIGDFTPIEWLHIWQVRLKDNDSLIANPLSSIPIPRNQGPFSALAIGQHVVVRTRGLEHIYDKSVVEIYWWEQYSGFRFFRSHFLAKNTVTTYLIGDDRILCADAEGVDLYDIPDLKLIDLARNLEPHDDDIPSLEPTWSYSFPSMALYFSPLYYSGAAYRFTTCTEDHIWGFTIPTIKEDDPSVVQLSMLNRHQVPCIPGLYKAFALHNVVGNGFRIGYHNRWENNGDGSVATVYPEDVLEASPLIGTSHLPPAFDEESGRFLYYRMDAVIILDFLGK